MNNPNDPYTEKVLKSFRNELLDIFRSYVEPLHSWYREQGVAKYSDDTKRNVKKFNEEVADAVMVEFESALLTQRNEIKERIEGMKKNAITDEKWVDAVAKIPNDVYHTTRDVGFNEALTAASRAVDGEKK